MTDRFGSFVQVPGGPYRSARVLPVGEVLETPTLAIVSGYDCRITVVLADDTDPVTIPLLFDAGVMQIRVKRFDGAVNCIGNISIENAVVGFW